jgi:hypothetical protein
MGRHGVSIPFPGGLGRNRPINRIRSSSEKPVDALRAVLYRNSYFWIDDRDLFSKKIFSFLMFVFTLVETGEKGTPPVVTIPTGQSDYLKGKAPGYPQGGRNPGSVIGGRLIIRKEMWYLNLARKYTYHSPLANWISKQFLAHRQKFSSN